MGNLHAATKVKPLSLPLVEVYLHLHIYSSILPDLRVTLLKISINSVISIQLYAKQKGP